MSAATLATLDLEAWFRLTADDGDPCSWCPAQQVTVALFEVQCESDPELPLCVEHRDVVARIVEQRGPDFECSGCGAMVRFLRFEALR